MPYNRNMSSFTMFQKMPVLNITVSLSEVLEVRDGPLTDTEIWALLCQSAEALQDIFMAGKYFTLLAQTFIKYDFKCYFSQKIKYWSGNHFTKYSVYLCHFGLNTLYTLRNYTFFWIGGFARVDKELQFFNSKNKKCGLMGQSSLAEVWNMSSLQTQCLICIRSFRRDIINMNRTCLCLRPLKQMAHVGFQRYFQRYFLPVVLLSQIICKHCIQSTITGPILTKPSEQFTRKISFQIYEVHKF